MSTALLTGARFIGQRLSRKEDARLLTGKGTFVDDVTLPGMLHAAFVRSPIARGRIQSIDTAAARAHPGVHAIYTAKDFEPLGINLMNGYPVEHMKQTQVPPMATDRVVHVGDPVAIVIADSRYIAEDAVNLVAVDDAEEAPVVTSPSACTGSGTSQSACNSVQVKQMAPDTRSIEPPVSRASMKRA